MCGPLARFLDARVRQGCRRQLEPARYRYASIACCRSGTRGQRRSPVTAARRRGVRLRPDARRVPNQRGGAGRRQLEPARRRQRATTCSMVYDPATHIAPRHAPAGDAVPHPRVRSAHPVPCLHELGEVPEPRVRPAGQRLLGILPVWRHRLERRRRRRRPRDPTLRSRDRHHADDRHGHWRQSARRRRSRTTSGTTYVAIGACREFGGTCTTNARLRRGVVLRVRHLHAQSGRVRDERRLPARHDVREDRGIVPASPDTDDDGIPDHLDNCIFIPERRSDRHRRRRRGRRVRPRNLRQRPPRGQRGSATGCSAACAPARVWPTARVPARPRSPIRRRSSP